MQEPRSRGSADANAKTRIDCVRCGFFSGGAFAARSRRVVGRTGGVSYKKMGLNGVFRRSSLSIFLLTPLV